MSAAADPNGPAPGPLVVAETLGLLRAWDAGATLPAPKARTLDLVGFAAAQGVAWPACQALARALPPPVAGLLLKPAIQGRETAAARLAAQLRDIAGLLAAMGIEAVALKGAAAIAAAGGEPAPWREMLDLDLLVAPADLPRAVDAMHGAGYTGDAEAYVATDYHFPALYPPPGGVATVELHTRTGWSRGGPLREIRARSLATDVPGLRLPTAEDRLVHLVHHAQIADRRWQRRSVRLRDALDWRLLTRTTGAPAPGGPVDVEAAAARFAAGRSRKAFQSFAVLMARIWETSAPPEWQARHAAWAEEVLGALADPAKAEHWREADRRRQVWDTLTSIETLEHLALGSLNPSRLRRFLRRI